MVTLPQQGLLVPVVPLDHAEGLEIAARQALPPGGGAHMVALPGQQGSQGRLQGARLLWDRVALTVGGQQELGRVSEWT